MREGAEMCKCPSFLSLKLNIRGDEAHTHQMTTVGSSVALGLVASPVIGCCQAPKRGGAFCPGMVGAVCTGVSLTEGQAWAGPKG